MNWEQLLDRRRFGEPFSSTVEDPGARNPFERDQDRVLYSVEFRRLGGKTQVFPLPESDETHTRLTHSLEVASAGRSIGRLIGNRTNAGKAATPDEIGSIVSAACLAHDIGNPPFGHSGENAIGEYFTCGSGRRFFDALSDTQQVEIANYEGNAAGFRIVATHGADSQNFNGFGLTYATLGALLKYPRTAASTKSATLGASEKKYGIFASDLSLAEDVATEVGMIQRFDQQSWYRHPLAFAVEAADDICYRIIDLEDAYRLGLITYGLVEDLLAPLANRPDRGTGSSRLKDIADVGERVGYLRGKAIGALIYEVVDMFQHNELEILSGKFDHALTDEIDSRQSLREMKSAMNSHVYNTCEVIEVEAAGFEVLGGLLDLFLAATIEHPQSMRSTKVVQLMGSSSYNGRWIKPELRYDMMLSIAGLVGGMTDYAAIDLYRKLRGIELRTY
jgi:dGTPase